MDKEGREIQALISLLGDDDRAIRTIAKEKLRTMSRKANPLLHHTVLSDAEGRVRIEAKALLEEWRLEQLTQSFRELNAASELDLETACFILAEIEYPNLNVSRYIEEIDRLAIEAEFRIHRVKDERERIRRISHFLFFEEGFRGNSSCYYDPENSYINKVLDRRLGIPISLSALFIFIAKRLNLAVEGVGFPGHFLLKFGTKSDFFFIDAFNRGQILSPKECRKILAKMGYPLLDFYFEPARSRDILARMIRNLGLIYSQKEQQNKIDTLERIFSNVVKNKAEG